MSDLIDTPRDRGNFEELARRANEIERLQARVDELEAEVQRLQVCLEASIDIEYGQAIKGDE